MGPARAQLFELWVNPSAPTWGLTADFTPLMRPRDLAYAWMLDSKPLDGDRSKWVPSGRHLNASERLLLALLKEMDLEAIPSATNGRWEIDAYVPQFNMAVEVDGRQFHTRPEDSSHDRAKEASLRAENILVVRIWSDDLRDPEKRAKARKHIATRLLAGRGIRVSAKRKRRILP